MRIFIALALVLLTSAPALAATAPDVRVTSIEVKAAEEVDASGHKHMVWRSKATASATPTANPITVHIAGLDDQGFQVALVHLTGHTDPKKSTPLLGTDNIKEKEPPKVAKWKVLSIAQ